ncbi:MAG: hypothetical protein L0I76_08450 [Pseudonocardia sp.]|nr:hypothetical protein [Pseudonocardia sp.]
MSIVRRLLGRNVGAEPRRPGSPPPRIAWSPLTGMFAVLMPDGWYWLDVTAGGPMHPADAEFLTDEPIGTQRIHAVVAQAKSDMAFWHRWDKARAAPRIGDRVVRLCDGQRGVVDERSDWNGEISLGVRLDRGDRLQLASEWVEHERNAR